MVSIAQISGLGWAGLTRSEAGGVEELSCAAMDAAIADAGLQAAQIDGLLISRSGGSQAPGLPLYMRSGLPPLSMLQIVECEGTSAIQMMLTASMAVASGVAKHIVCVFGDTPLAGGSSGRQAFTKPKPTTGIASLRFTSGAHGAAAHYALSASRYLHEYGVDEAQLGAVAVSTRAWACLNPDAVMRKPLSLDEYLASRYIVSPLRLYDCALPVNGAIAIVVSPGTHRSDGASVPVHIHGIGQAHAGPSNSFHAWARESVALARDTALGQAGVPLSAIDVREFYDAFSIMTLLALEDYGFCGRGEAGALAAAGALGPNGDLPTNTGGGQLSAFYMQGMTPVLEAIMQARGTAGARQCPRHDIVLASNDGGWFDHHACAILSRHATLS